MSTIVHRQQPKISLGVKIFGIATTMLALLGVVAYVSSNRLRQVNREIQSLAEYTIPITDLVAQVDIYALEQQKNTERLIRYYQLDSPDWSRIDEEREQFDRRRLLVDEELAKAAKLTVAALDRAQIDANRQVWSAIEPQLEQIEQEYQDLHDRSIAIFELLEAGQFNAARELEAPLETDADNFARQMEGLVLELKAFTIQASKTAQGHQAVVQHLSRSAAIIATVFGLFYASVVTRGLVRPMRRLVRSMESVQQGNLDTYVEVKTTDEIATLTRAFNEMVKELQLKARLEDTFGKYVDPRVVKRLATSSEEAQTQGERKVMTVFFSDIDGFNAIADTLSAEELVEFTNRYLTLMSAPVSNHSGVIDKFIGSMVMGFWGSPFTSKTEHAELACYAALEQLARLDRLRELVAEFSEKLATTIEIDLHVGIATGLVVVGNMGSALSKSYTVMGDTVNAASRLKGVGKQYGIPIALLDATRNQAGKAIETREIDLVQVVGKEEPVRVYELLGRQGEIEPELLNWRDLFEKGLVAYRIQDWERAQQYFQTCKQVKPDDRPTAIYLDRIQTFQNHSPGEDWDGVWHLTKK